MIEQQEFAVRIECDSSDEKRRVGDLLAPQHAVAVVLDRPDLTGGVIRIDISPSQFGEVLAVVDNPAG